MSLSRLYSAFSGKWAFGGLLCLLVSACIPARGRIFTKDDHKRALALIDQGVIQLRVGQLERAAGSFGMAYDMAFLPAALDGMGCVALRQGEYKRAQDYFLRAYASDPSYTTALGNLAQMYAKLGYKPEAAELFRRSIRGGPDEYRIRNNYGVFLATQGQQHAAITELYKARAISDDPRVQMNIRRYQE